MVNIGVLTSSGQMYLVQAPNITGHEITEDIAEAINGLLEDIGTENFNWQILDEVMEPTGTTTAFRVLVMPTKIKAVA